MARKDAQRGKRATAADRRVKALELRKSGSSYRQIGAQLGVSEKTAHQDVQRSLAHLAALERSDAGDLRMLEQIRLDTLQMAATQVLLATDDQLKLAAIDRLVRISESRRKLLGLDAAPKVPLNPDGSPAQYAAFRALVLGLLPMEQRLLLADALDGVNDGVVGGGSEAGT